MKVWNFSKENENEIPEFDRDLVPDPVLSFLRLVGAWPGDSRRHPGLARSWRCHFHINWSVETPFSVEGLSQKSDSSF